MLMLEHAVRDLIARGAIHNRKQTVMGQEQWSDVLKHLHEEIEEFRETLLLGTIRQRRQEELGDILGIVMHMIVKAGFTFAEVEQRELEKIKERFTLPQQ